MQPFIFSWGDMKRIAFTALVLAGCTPEHVILFKEVVSVVASLKPDKKPEVIPPTPVPTSTPIIAPTIAPEPVEPEPVVIVPCGRKNPQDGAKRGFTWKPNSDTQKWAVAVLPQGIPGNECTFAGLPARYKGDIGGAHEGTEKRAVTILDGWTGERLKKEHGPIRVRCGCYWWSIPNPSVRVD